MNGITFFVTCHATHTTHTHIIVQREAPRQRPLRLRSRPLPPRMPQTRAAPPRPARGRGHPRVRGVGGPGPEATRSFNARAPRTVAGGAADGGVGAGAGKRALLYSSIVMGL